MRVGPTTIITRVCRGTIFSALVDDSDIVEFHKCRDSTDPARDVSVAFEEGPSGRVGPVWQIAIEPESSSTIICADRRGI